MPLSFSNISSYDIFEPMSSLRLDVFFLLFWKSNLVTPSKGLDLSNTVNYRPISLQSIFSKMFDNIVTEKISFILNNTQ